MPSTSSTDRKTMHGMAYDSYGVARMDDHAWRRGHQERISPSSPPPPEVPTAQERLRYYSATHSSSAYRSRMRFETLLGLLAAVRIHGGIFAAPLMQAAADSKQDGSAMALAGIADAFVQGRRGDFTERLVARIASCFDAGDAHFRESWDWDGPGIWCKSSIDVRREEDAFVLHMTRASADPDAELAARIGRRLCFHRAEHTVTYPSDQATGRYRIPFDAIRTVAALAGGRAPEPQALVESLRIEDMDANPSFTLFEDADIRVSVTPAVIYMPSRWELARLQREEGGTLHSDPTLDDDFRIRAEFHGNEALLTGRAKRFCSYPDPMAGGLTFHIEARDGRGWDPEVEERAMIISRHIANLHNHLPSAWS